MTPSESAVAATVLAVGPVLSWVGLCKRIERLPDGRIGSTTGLMIVLAATSGVVLLGAPSAPEIRWRMFDVFDLSLALATSPLLWSIAILVGILSKLTGTVVESADIDPWGDDSGSDDAPDDRGPTDDPLCAYVLVSLALVGPAEELLFRGIVQPVLVDAFGVGAGLTAMSALFGLYHYPNSVDSLRAIDAAAVREMTLSGLGAVVLGILYLYSGNLLVPIVGHSLHDAGLFVYLHARAGGRTDVDAAPDAR